MTQIVPSILSADFARLAEEIHRVEQANISLLHIDIMDGHFVPNLTMGPPVVKSIRKITKATLDLHCMIENPDRYAPLFIEAGADQISVHQEACTHLDRTIRLIQEMGAKAGVAINPATPVGTLEDVLDIVDYVLVMSVNPGFEAQMFLPNSLNKIRALARMREERQLRFAIEIDGGVSNANVTEIVRAGCDWLVAGSAVFHSADPARTVKEMQQLAENASALYA
jgi:ribulose-phosphate 3-epimerase